MESGKEYKKGLWTEEEDKVLVEYVKIHGKGKWNRVPKLTGLKRCGKSCRLRWINYLTPGVKRGDFSEEEEDLIIRLHNLLGNRWSLIAGRVPGRTDNQVKNYWNTHLNKKLGKKSVKFKIPTTKLHKKKKMDENLHLHLESVTFNKEKNNDPNELDNKENESINNNFENLSWFCTEHPNPYSPLVLDPLFEFPQDQVWQDFQ